MHLDRIYVLSQCLIFALHISDTCLGDDGILHAVDLLAELLSHRIKCFLWHHGDRLHRVCSLWNTHLGEHGCNFFASG